MFIQFESITKTFAGVTALDRVSLSIGREPRSGRDCVRRLLLQRHVRGCPAGALRRGRRIRTPEQVVDGPRHAAERDWWVLLLARLRAGRRRDHSRGREDAEHDEQAGGAWGGRSRPTRLLR